MKDRRVGWTRNLRLLWNATGPGYRAAKLPRPGAGGGVPHSTGHTFRQVSPYRACRPSSHPTNALNNASSGGRGNRHSRCGCSSSIKMAVGIGVSTGDILCSIPVRPHRRRRTRSGSVPIRPFAVEFVEFTDEHVCIAAAIGVIATDQCAALRYIGGILGVIVALA